MSKYTEYVEAAKHPASGSSPEEMAAGAVDANTMATLAVADQLRIANLIALGAIGGGPITRVSGAEVERYVSVRYPDIADALGIEEADDE